MRTLWLDNDDVVGDELPDGASRVGIGDNASMERIDEDSASADAGDLGGELLYTNKMHMALAWSARSFFARGIANRAWCMLPTAGRQESKRRSSEQVSILLRQYIHGHLYRPMPLSIILLLLSFVVLHR